MDKDTTTRVRPNTIHLHCLVGGQQNSPICAYLHSLIDGTNSFLTDENRVTSSLEIEPCKISHLLPFYKKRVNRRSRMTTSLHHLFQDQTNALQNQDYIQNSNHMARSVVPERCMIRHVFTIEVSMCPG